MVNQLLLFGLVGVINTSIDWGTFWAIGVLWPRAITHLWIVKIASYSVGVLSSFLLNSSYTFRREYTALQVSRRGNRLFIFARFWTVACLCAVINSTTYI